MKKVNEEQKNEISVLLKKQEERNVSNPKLQNIQKNNYELNNKDNLEMTTDFNEIDKNANLNDSIFKDIRKKINENENLEDYQVAYFKLFCICFKKSKNNNKFKFNGLIKFKYCHISPEENMYFFHESFLELKEKERKLFMEHYKFFCYKNKCPLAFYIN